MILPSQIPTAKARFRPRADAGILSSLLQECWRERNAAIEAARDSSNVGEVLAAHMESLYPSADMEVLRRYGAAADVTEISVRAYNASTEHFDCSMSIKLAHSVCVPHRGNDIYAGGKRWSDEPGRGVSAAYKAELEAAGTWESFCADQDKRDAVGAPDSIWPFFASVVEARLAYQTEYRQTTDWPEQRKREAGDWPTWLEIEAAFPTFGAYVARQREASPAIDACA